jgi:sulfite exporter TauE/SafE
MLCSGKRSLAASGRHVLMVHAGRMAAYALAGAAVGAAGAPVVAWFDREMAYRLLQWAGAAALMWVGLSTAGLLPPLVAADRLLAPLADRFARSTARLGGHVPTAFLAGLSWGLMPCAMVYGALFTAMLTGSAENGATVMLAFGVGTLPGLLAAAIGFRLLSRAAARRDMRAAAGIAIAVAAFMTVWVAHPAAGVLCLDGDRGGLVNSAR